LRDGRASASAQAVTLARAHLHGMGALDDPWSLGWLTPGRRRLARMLGRWPLRAYGRGPTFALA